MWSACSASAGVSIPFGAVRKDGLIYSRGANDDKDHVVAGLMVMLLLKRMHVKLDRDVIFLAEAGEEGTTQVGIDYMVNHHWPDIDAEYAMAEGGSVIEVDGRVHHVLINVTEKVPRGARLIARGPSGHGSRPSPQNPVVHSGRRSGQGRRLADAVAPQRMRRARISSGWQPSVRRARPRVTGLFWTPHAAPTWTATFFEHEPGHYTLLRTSVVPTILQAGFRTNVIPSEAEAYLDIRALPDEDMPKFFGELRRVINDPMIEVVPTQNGGRPAAPAFAHRQRDVPCA